MNGIMIWSSAPSARVPSPNAFPRQSLALINSADKLDVVAPPLSDELLLLLSSSSSHDMKLNAAIAKMPQNNNVFFIVILFLIIKMHSMKN